MPGYSRHPENVITMKEFGCKIEACFEYFKGGGGGGGGGGYQMSPKDPKETQKTLSISVQLNSVPTSPSKIFNPLNFVPVYSVTVYMQ